MTMVTIRKSQAVEKSETLLDAFQEAIAREGSPRAGRLYHAPEGVPLPPFHASAIRREPCVTILKGASAGKSECVTRPLGPLVTR